MIRDETLVVGGGPAGAAAAIEIARAGLPVTVFERERTASPRLCGEFISGEALDDLGRLGVDAFALGAAPIRLLRVAAGARMAETALPFQAAGLSRRTLDAAILHRAEATGAEVARGVSARVACDAAGAVRVTLPDRADTAEARCFVLATGKSGSPGEARPTRWRGRRDMLGFKMTYRLSDDARAELGAAVELHLFPGGCAGLAPIEGGDANLCMTLSRRALRSLEWGDVLERLGGLCPLLARRLAGAEPRWDRPLAIAGVPYGYLRNPTRAAHDRIWRVGDQAAVTASFSGGGLALALASGRLAGRMIARGRSVSEFERDCFRRSRRQVARAMLVQRLFDVPALHGAIVAGARAAPSLLQRAAAATRLPASDR